MIFHIEQLSESLLPSCNQLTYPQFRPFLSRSLYDPDVIAGTAVFMGEAAGLVIARVQAGQNHGAVFFLYVSPHYRRLGIGARLLEFAENRLRAAGCRTLEFAFTGPGEGRPELAQLLRARDWGDLKIIMELYVRPVQRDRI